MRYESKIFPWTLTRGKQRGTTTHNRQFWGKQGVAPVDVYKGREDSIKCSTELHALGTEDAQRINALWNDVLFLAISDAFGDGYSNCKKVYGTLISERALHWVINPNRDFFEVCELANKDHLSVRRVFIEKFIGKYGFHPNKARFKNGMVEFDD